MEQKRETYAARSTEEQSKNLCHKVFSRRGEMAIRVVEMREEEMINKDGKVVLKEVVNREQQERAKRGRSPGSTPPARRPVEEVWQGAVGGVGEEGGK